MEQKIRSHAGKTHDCPSATANEHSFCKNDKNRRKNGALSTKEMKNIRCNESEAVEQHNWMSNKVGVFCSKMSWTLFFLYSFAWCLTCWIIITPEFYIQCFFVRLNYHYIWNVFNVSTSFCVHILLPVMIFILFSTINLICLITKMETLI